MHPMPSGMPAPVFQPTLPLRGATSRASARFITTLFQPTLPLRGATEPAHVRDIDVWFQPTLPLRGATPEGGRAVPHLPRVSTHAPLAGSDEGQIAPSQPDLVSTHAPLAGSDRQAPWCTCAGAGFNPRSPCGERRPPAAGVASLPMSFNPRSPCGERPRVRARTRVSHGFNPRSPCGERQLAERIGAGGAWFQPTLPLRGATACRVCCLGLE